MERHDSPDKLGAINPFELPIGDISQGLLQLALPGCRLCDQLADGRLFRDCQDLERLQQILGSRA